MKTEKEIIEQIIELAKESGKKSVEIKIEADRIIENTPEAIDKHETKIKLMAQELSQIEYVINKLVQLFGE